MIRSTDEIRRAYAQAPLVDRAALAGHQDGNDALAAFETMNSGLRADLGPILARVRADAGGAINPIAADVESCYHIGACGRATGPEGQGIII